jgi:hypothetical protein
MNECKMYFENDEKKFRSENYNYTFNLKTGYFQRWGKTIDDDPAYSPFGPEIIDIEVSTICSKGCPFCYKGNTSTGSNMSFETFKQIIDTFPMYDGHNFTTQIAFGVGSIDANPDLWEMMIYCRSLNIIPNITINGDGLTDYIVEKLVTLCGAISVSNYCHDTCYNAVQRLRDAGCKQLNIHHMLSEETFHSCCETLVHTKTDPRLRGLNAVVFLSLKQKGRGINHKQVSYEKFKELVVFATKNNIRIGFDSCGCNKLLEVAKEIGKYDDWIEYAEPCESCSFSSYISTDGVFFPCSFAAECCIGQDITKVDNFIEVWHSKYTILERDRIQGNNRNCPYFVV